MAETLDDLRLSDPTYIELVRSLFDTLVPTLIMNAAFAVVGSIAVMMTRDMTLSILLVSGIIAALWRIAILLLHRGRLAGGGASAVDAGRAERRFAFAYFAFAALFGLFMARCFVLAGAELRFFCIALVYGYGAGVAAGISLRPWVGVPSILLGVVPFVAVAFYCDDGSHGGLAVITLFFLAGGIESMLRRYRGTVRRLAVEHRLSVVDRHDALTGLPNQLTLEEHFAGLAALGAAQSLVAVHAIGCDNMESINHQLGFVAGDDILKAVADRLRRIVPVHDMAVRLPGARFAVVQTALAHERRAETFARELYDVLSAPFAIAGSSVALHLSIGYAAESRAQAQVASLVGKATEAQQRARAEALGIAHDVRTRWSA